MIKDLTSGTPTKVIVSFAIPMIIGNLFQQLYNIVDSIIVGKFIGKDALAAVGSSFTIMVFLTSIILGLCMGASVAFSQLFGAKKIDDLKDSIFSSFIFVGLITLVLNLLSLLYIKQIIHFMNIPPEIFYGTQSYLTIIFCGITFTFLYNWAAGLLRALGNSKTPLYFLILAAVINTILDIVFIVIFNLGVSGAAFATIIAQFVSAVLCLFYCFKKLHFLQFKWKEVKWNPSVLKMTISYSLMTSVQQSIMNFGILLIQGLVNSFGIAAMAAFAAAAKIDSFAYMPVQDFGNALSTYIAQNKGAGKESRINYGLKCSFLLVTAFCIVISTLVILFSKQLMHIFIKPEEIQIIAIGVKYLCIVAFFYCLIGYLFMFYGFYRGVGNVKMSIILTIVSLGTRVGLAYILAPLPKFGLVGIWWAIPIGWLLADIIGTLFYFQYKKRNALTTVKSHKYELLQ